MKYLIIPVLLLYAFLSSYGQVEQSRYELERRNSDQDFAVFSAGDNGLILFNELKPERVTNLKRFEFVMLDPLLQEVVRDTIQLEPYFGLRFMASEGTRVFMVFEHIESDIPQYRIIRADYSTGRILPFYLTNELPFESVTAEAVGGQLIIGGQVKGGVPALLSFEEGRTNFRLLPGSAAITAEILDVRSNLNSETFNLVAIDNDPVNPVLHVLTYGDGQVLFRKAIQLEHEMINARSLGFIDGDIIITGSYGSRELGYTMGMVFIRLTSGEGKDIIRYHDAASFSHFFDYAESSRKQRLNDRAEKRSEQGEDLKLNKHLFIQDLSMIGDQFVVRFDVFQDLPGSVRFTDSRNAYETVRNSTLNPYQMFGSSVFRSAIYPEKYLFYRRAFLGFENDVPGDNTGSRLEYLQQWSAGMDATGDVLWDNAMVVLEQDRLRENRLINASVTTAGIQYFYRVEGKVVYSEPQFVSEESKEYILDLTLLSPDHRFIDEYASEGGVIYNGKTGIYPWGIQRIAGDDGRRSVIYINRIYPSQAN